MFIKQFVDEGLGNSSYLLASEETGLAIAIDPQRDVDRYLQTAEGLGLRLTHALDTHLHNDFVSGAYELATRAGVVAGASAGAGLHFDHLPLEEGASIPLGDLRVGVLATPGHTPEHISFAVGPAGANAPAALFSGGALIVGGAARTDLLGPESTGLLTHDLYHTLHNKLLRLPDEVVLYPTHGAGSFCATPATVDRTSTLGRERRSNPLAQAVAEDEFRELALADLPSYPTYFQYMRPINQRGPRILGKLPQLSPLAPEAVQDEMAKGTAIIDIREPETFMAGHLPAAYGIPLGAPLITWAGWVIPFGTPLVLLAENAAQRGQAVRQLIRIGYDDLRGYLDGGTDTWEAAGLPVRRVPVMSPEELRQEQRRGKAPIVLDVRQDSEWWAGHLPEALHVEAGSLPVTRVPLARDERIVVHCATGDRSTVAISILEQQGYDNLALLAGGFVAWQEAGYPVTHDSV